MHFVRTTKAFSSPKSYGLHAAHFRDGILAGSALSLRTKLPQFLKPLAHVLTAATSARITVFTVWIVDSQ